ncbi:MAG: hypothetical protein HQ568_09115 [Calditrichaeota bacterium]|nr:hypothetical protein [Calditrichota bacterium]
MNNSEILAGLDEKEAMLMVHIERLKLDIESIKRTKLIFSGDSESQIEMKSIIETPTNSKIKPTQAIREMFDTYPDRKWFPGQIRDRLETMRDADKLNSNYENLLYAVHSILREMTKRGEIDKSEPDKNKRRWYKKK